MAEMPIGGRRRRVGRRFAGGLPDGRDLEDFARRSIQGRQWSLPILDTAHAGLAAIVDRHRRRGTLGEHVRVEPPHFLRNAVDGLRRLPDVEGCTFWIEDDVDRPGLPVRLSR